MKTHIRRQQHKNVKHQDTKQKEPPQKYRLGTISNTKLLAVAVVVAEFSTFYARRRFCAKVSDAI